MKHQRRECAAAPRAWRALRPGRGRAGRCAALALCAAALGACSHETHAPARAPDEARFEFLTPTLLRMEYAPGGRFVDAPTAVVLKRDWPAVPVRRTQRDGWLSIASTALAVRYRVGSGPFTAANLEVSWQNADGTHGEWRPGQTDPGNLGGLTYSLDNISQANLPKDGTDLASPVNDLIPGIDLVLPAATPGLLSRSGYALIDDSHTPVRDLQRNWIAPRAEQHAQDWYLFAYGHDYRRVLREYAQLCGPIPMIPRYVLGAWVTDFNFEYFPDAPQAGQPDFQRYNQANLEAEIERLRAAHIPLDVLVLDFAWHNYGWDGGYDWSPLFPHPDELIRFLHGRGIKLSLNDHPGYINTNESIVSYADTHAAAVLRALGREVPPRPAFDLDVTQGWRFAADPDDRGVRERWYQDAGQKAPWRPIKPGLPWQQQGYPQYRGVGWYRAEVALPAQLPGALYLYVGEVHKAYRLFVNGHELSHSKVHWPHRLTYADIGAYVTAGEQNVLVLRVEPDVQGPDGLGVPLAIRDVKPPPVISLDLSDQRQAEASMRELHGPLMQQGADLWWVDGGSGAVSMPGLNRQLWTNEVFYDYTERASGRRAFILGRYGDWGSERSPGYFTGDAYSEWPVLSYEVAVSARGGNVLMPYISHDIGGFHGGKIDFDLYARWLEFGTFSGLLRLHSAHANPLEGNLRMPWVYGDAGLALLRKYFNLRTQLIPYLYTYSWRAHTEALPLLRPLYLEYPQLEEAYAHPHEYFLGGELLVAPVLTPSGAHSLYLPPGEWLDFFSGRRFHGGTTLTAHYRADETPVFVRAGAIIPEQPLMDYSDARPLDTLILNLYGSGKGSFELYEDDGISLAYRHGAFARTTMTYVTSAGRHQLTIEPLRGSFDGQVGARAYEIRLHGTERPGALQVAGSAGPPWRWDAAGAAWVAQLPRQPLNERTEVSWR